MRNIQPITLKTLELVCDSPVLNGKILASSKLLLEKLPPVGQLTDCIFIWVCLKGEARYTCDTEVYHVKPNDFNIVSRGQIVENCYISDDYYGKGFVISSDFFTEITQSVHDLTSTFMFARNYPMSHFLEDEVQTFLNYHEKIEKKIMEINHRFRYDVVRSLFTTMIYDLGNAIARIQTRNATNHTRAEQLFFMFIEKLTENFRTERRVSWYSQAMNISPKYLFEMVKEVSGHTPNEWIDMFVVKEMRLLLKNSTLSIKEIALQLNFTNQSFMSKYFKMHTGYTPTQYRRS